MRRRAALPKAPPRRRRLGWGFLALALLAVGAWAFGEYRDWQLRDSCTGNAGRWDEERQACTFGGGTVPTAPDPSR
jgi:hypothetical protein